METSEVLEKAIDHHDQTFEGTETTSHSQPVVSSKASHRKPIRALMSALLGFFIITLDALIVSVALPAIRDSLGGGVVGLQWVVDGYTLPFAAFLLMAGTLSDRLGAKVAFGSGLVVFTVSSAGCGFAPTLPWLIFARVLKGLGAALMTPASLALIGEAYPDPTAKARAIGYWAIGGAVASAAGPLIGGALTVISWRLIFLVNLPVGLFTLWLLFGIGQSKRRRVPLDWAGQLTSIVGLVALTFGLIEAGQIGITDLKVIALFAIAAASCGAFLLVQSRHPHPMVPLGMFKAYVAAVPIAIGFAFMFGFFGMVFLVSLYLQEVKQLNPLQTGLAFVPVTGMSFVMPILGARLAEQFGPRTPIALGQAAMVAGLGALCVWAESSVVWQIVLMMVPVGLGGGLAMPSATSVLLNNVPQSHAGTASGVLNTSRQVGGALAIAAFGTLIASYGFTDGLQISFAISTGLLLATMLASLGLNRSVS